MSVHFRGVFTAFSLVYRQRLKARWEEFISERYGKYCRFNYIHTFLRLAMVFVCSPSNTLRGLRFLARGKVKSEAEPARKGFSLPIPGRLHILFGFSHGPRV